MARRAPREHRDGDKGDHKLPDSRAPHRAPPFVVRVIGARPVRLTPPLPPDFSTSYHPGFGAVRGIDANDLARNVRRSTAVKPGGVAAAATRGRMTATDPRPFA